MNTVWITGGKAKEREIAEHTVYFCINKLMPRVRSLDIEVKLTKCDAYGYCLNTDNRKTFELEIRKGLSIYDLISTICHEMVHVKQYFRKELSDAGLRKKWKSKTVSEKVEYEDQPWEKEAFKLEEELALECFKQMEVNI